MERVQQRRRAILVLLSVLFGTLLATPGALALRMGFSPIDRTVGMIGRIFHAPSLQNIVVAEGFARFAFFILIFTIIHWAAHFAFKKSNDVDDVITKKTRIIVALVFALISAFMVPRNVIMASATGYSAIIWSIIAVGPTLAAWYFAFKGKKGATGADAAQGLFDHAIGLLALIFGWLWALIIVDNLVLWLRTLFPNVADIVDYVAGWVWIFTFIAIIIKIAQLIGAVRTGAGRMGGAPEDPPTATGPGRRVPAPPAGGGAGPGQVPNPRGVMNP